MGSRNPRPQPSRKAQSQERKASAGPAELQVIQRATSETEQLLFEATGFGGGSLCSILAVVAD